MSVEAVGAFAAVEGVVACVSVEAVGAFAAAEGVGALAAVELVVAASAVQGVVACAAVEDVVAAEAADHVGLLGADENVVAVRASDRADKPLAAGPERHSRCCQGRWREHHQGAEHATGRSNHEPARQDTPANSQPHQGTLSERAGQGEDVPVAVDFRGGGPGVMVRR